jgi:MYXO-CTERM domain-containing protein
MNACEPRPVVDAGTDASTSDVSATDVSVTDVSATDASDAGASDIGVDGGTSVYTGGGCNCRVSAPPTSRASGAWLLALGLAGVIHLRRRARRA